MTRRSALRLGATALAGLVLVGLGALVAQLTRPPVLEGRIYAGMRIIAVQIHLDEAPPEYVFYGGDSQVELQPGDQRPCGLPLVNGGVSGATAAAYAERLSGLRFPVRPRVAALTVGTNDILLKNDPRSPASAARFEASAERIVRALQAVSGRVVVTALPPVGRGLGHIVDAEAVGDYSRRLQALCGRLGCVFADPFAALRDGAGGYANPGGLRDGLHLGAFRQALAALEPALCRP